MSTAQPVCPPAMQPRQMTSSHPRQTTIDERPTTVHDHESPQSRFPRRRPGHPLSARHQSPAQRDAPAGRQAHHSIRRRRGDGLRLRPDPHHHRPRQAGHRRPLRRQLRTREDARGAPQDRPAQDRPQDFRHDARRLRPPERSAGPGPRRAHGARTRRQRAFRRAARRRRHRRPVPASSRWSTSSTRSSAP